ncbi:MAG: N-acetylmuramoyl-L-alanine amidase [Thermodesulfovibrionia bacterium]|nr:N-acetylmuramoyl-L-alanine amidase [Thermodesulfovibrionia bacterium]
MKKILLAFVILMVFISSRISAVEHVSILGVRYLTYKTYTRVVIDLSSLASFNSNRLKKPERLYFDIKGCTLAKDTKTSIAVNNGILKKIRSGQFSEDTARVTLDLEGMSQYSAFVLENPDRLVIDIYKPEAALAPLIIESKPFIKEIPDDVKIKTIVIDPGHGGKDPGAVGPNGLKEKDVVLDVGKRLGEILNERYGVNIIYTRKTDVFIPLNERTEIANSNNADLFISVHANANTKRSAKGIETYILNWTNDDESLKVAARENNISISKMKLLRGGLQMILDDLTRSHKKQESVKFARNLQDSMVSTLKDQYNKTTDLGIKQALFYVLVGAEMPSALVEVSFISNSDEEKLLASKGYRDRIAEGIAEGVGDYIKGSTLMARQK